MEWEVIGHTKEEIEPFKRLCSCRSKVDAREVKTLNQTCLANGPKRGSCHSHLQAQACEAGPSLWSGAGMPLVHLPKKSMLSQ